MSRGRRREKKQQPFFIFPAWWRPQKKKVFLKYFQATQAAHVCRVYARTHGMNNTDYLWPLGEVGVSFGWLISGSSPRLRKCQIKVRPLLAGKLAAEDAANAFLTPLTPAKKAPSIGVTWRSSRIVLPQVAKVVTCKHR